MKRDAWVRADSVVRVARFCLCCMVFFSILVAPLSEGPLPPTVSAQEIQNEVKTDTVPSQMNLTIYGEPRRLYHRKGDDLVTSAGKDCIECHLRAFYPGRDFFKWEYRKKWDIHWMLFSVACFVMMTGIYGAVSIWRKGEGPSLHHPVHWASVGRALFWDVFLGKRIWRQSRLRWAIFFFISMAFVQLFFVFIAMVVTRYLFPAPFFMTGIGGTVLDCMADLLGLMILVGVLLALYRRYVLKEEHLESQAEDTSVLWMLLAIIVTGFFLEACRLAVVPLTPRMYASFVGALGAAVLKSWDVGWTGVRFYVWFIHAMLVFVFIAYLPFSKLFHVITCPVSILATASENAYRQYQ